MNYSQLQQALKNYRNDGISVLIPLNSKQELLQAEYDRITSIPVTPGTDIFNSAIVDTLELFAKSLAGNWKKFECFLWDRYNDLDSDNLAILYTKTRDSDLVAESNHYHILRMLQPYIDLGLVSEESHNHWACGSIDGLVFPVRNDKGLIHDHVKLLYSEANRLAKYPLLDEDDYSNREYAATQDSLEQLVKDAIRSFSHDISEDCCEMIVSYIKESVNNIECDQFGNVMCIDVEEYIFPAIEASIPLDILAEMIHRLSADANFFEVFAEDEEEPYLDLRLNFTDTWDLRYGSSDYDPSHEGLWACSSVTHNQSLEDCTDIAQQLINDLE